MLDTNIIISAVVFDGKIENLLRSLKDEGHELLVSDYVETKFKEKVNKKWPDKKKRHSEIYKNFLFVRCESTEKILGNGRDKKDIPVLSDAIYHKVDILLTGDKYFFGERNKKSACDVADDFGWIYAKIIAGKNFFPAPVFIEKNFSVC